MEIAISLYPFGFGGKFCNKTFHFIYLVKNDSKFKNQLGKQVYRLQHLTAWMYYEILYYFIKKRKKNDFRIAHSRNIFISIFFIGSFWIISKFVKRLSIFLFHSSICLQWFFCKSIIQTSDVVSSHIQYLNYQIPHKYF